MEKKELLEQVTQVFRDVLEDDTIQLTENTAAADVAGWDSLAHIQLVVAIEKHFNIRFTSTELLEWQNVGEMLDCIRTK
jgi:acyl carrier protein